MRKSTLILLALILVTLMGTAMISRLFFPVSAQSEFKPHSLLTASVADVEKAALDYTASYSRILEPPRILLTRTITKQELPELGLSEIGYRNHEPPLALVVLEGKFEIQPRGLTTAGPDQVKYIFYVLDLNVGVPTYTEYSRDGKGYAKFLAYVKSATTAPGDQPIDPNAKYFEPGPIQTAIPAAPTPGPSAPEKPK
ncbi:MAG: hypothetical protein BroJett039_04350 [Chloroflexota bacterium]|nr:MAG: hypothetical protein BroJett039_04350 [Chloroflexota bacterium]